MKNLIVIPLISKTNVISSFFNTTVGLLIQTNEYAKGDTNLFVNLVLVLTRKAVLFEIDQSLGFAALTSSLGSGSNKISYFVRTRLNWNKQVCIIPFDQHFRLLDLLFLIVLLLLLKNRDENYRAVSIWIVVWNEDFESENSFLVNALTNENDAIPN